MGTNRVEPLLPIGRSFSEQTVPYLGETTRSFLIVNDYPPLSRLWYIFGFNLKNQTTSPAIMVTFDLLLH
jgi:hypothetical protein